MAEREASTGEETHGRSGGLRAFVADQIAWAEANWKFLTFAAWLGIVTYFLIVRWGAIYWMALGDTDDNMRYLQVKDWLAGQSWYDLRQYRLNPPAGFDIHWSRLVDLPIAGLMLVFSAFMATPLADRLALGVEPLLPLLPLMLALAFIARRLAPGPGWAVAALLPLAGGMAIGMFMPLRIDHHGWQLALLTVMLAGLVDDRPRRGGLVIGIATALSVAIGMEMIVYLAAAGALVALRWAFGIDGADRMRTYAASLGAGTAACFALFASNANRAPVCDALSPVWTTLLLLAAAGLLGLSFLPPLDRWRRLGLGSLVGLAVLAFAWVTWPQCLTGAYQISPELDRLWLDNIREAKSITEQSRSSWTGIIALPVIGIVGALVACWASRRDGARLWAWATIALMSLFAAALLFWQVRTGPAAQLLAIPGAAWAAGWGVQSLAVRGAWVRRSVAVLALGAALAVMNVSYWVQRAGAKPETVRSKAIRTANGRCRALPALALLNKLPPATIFTLVDLGPRLIATTHHRAIAGPYHRNGDAILDVHHAFDGPPSAFRPIARRHGATYLLICPWFPEGTVYSARSPRGFYQQLMKGHVPVWLTPVSVGPLKAMPFKLWRIDYSAQDGKKIAQ